MRKDKAGFIEEVDTPTRNMRGKGAPKSTVFGVIGSTMEDNYSRTLGGLVKHTASGSVKGIAKKGFVMTERDIMGNVSKTPTPGSHYGQVLYHGDYMAAAGAAMS
jgi:hypothetical protein